MRTARTTYVPTPTTAVTSLPPLPAPPLSPLFTRTHLNPERVRVVRCVWGGGRVSQEAGGAGETSAVHAMEIKDMTNTNMLNLRRTIFLTIMSSVNFEECVHKVRRTTAASSLRALVF